MWLPDVLAVHVCFLEKKTQQNTWWLATKPGCVYVSGALVEVSDLEVRHPPRLTARRMSRFWNAAGRLCGCNELTSKGVHKSHWHASTLTSPRPSVALTPTDFEQSFRLYVFCPLLVLIIYVLSSCIHSQGHNRTSAFIYLCSDLGKALGVKKKKHCRKTRERWSDSSRCKRIVT